MRELDNIYRRLLTIGLIHTRDLLRDGRVMEAKLEMDHLYAIPQLLGSASRVQHEFYLDSLRPRFVEEAQALGVELLVQHIMEQYVPIWADLRAAMAAGFDDAAG